MTKDVKGGRTASPEERAYALQLVAEYKRLREMLADDPDGSKNGVVHTFRKDPAEELVEALQRLGNEGYLRPIGFIEFAFDVGLWWEYHEATGTNEQRIGKAADAHGISETTARRRLARVRGLSKRDTD